MRLHTDTVDQSLFFQFQCHLADRIGFLRYIFVEVIVIQLGVLRCILSGILKCRLNEGVVTEHLDPCRIVGVLGLSAAGAGNAVVQPCFIDHIPCVEVYGRIFLFQSCENIFDVVFHTLEHHVLGYPVAVVLKAFLKEPVRCLAVPYQHVSANRNVVITAVIQNGSGTCQIDDRIGVAAGCLGCALVQDGFRFQLVAQGNAVEVLGDEILGGLRSQFVSGHCGANLEIVGIHVLEGRNVFLNGVYRSRAYFEIVDVHGGFVVALEVQVYLGNVLGEAELHVGECCPVAVAGLCLQIAVVAFAAGIGVFHAQIDRVVPLGLCHSADGVLHAGFALVVQQELRAVPVLRSVADAHGV